MRTLELPEYDKDAFASKYGPWAVIAGASEGTGACYAEQLAAMGINVVLVSRRANALEALGQRLVAEYNIKYRTVPLDLMKVGAGIEIVAVTSDLDVGLYISNAGADGAGNSFFGEPLERSVNVLNMNAANVMSAVHGFGNRFLARGRGGIIIMSSLAGLGGQPWLVMYSATKAFEVNLVESLWAELEGTNVDITCICAPTMNTPTLQRAAAGTGFDTSGAYDPAEVVHVALATLGREPMIAFPDGPDEHMIPEVQAVRKHRLVALAEWGKAYTSGAQA